MERWQKYEKRLTIICRKHRWSTNKGYDKKQINFCDKTIQDHIEAITLIDQELVYTAVSSSKRYEDTMDMDFVPSFTTVRVVSLSVSNNKIFASHDEGITAVELQSHARHMIYKSQNAKCSAVAFEKGILFTDQLRATLYKRDEDNNIKKFAGCEVEGCQDGPVAECKFKQPMGACVEFDNVVYVCDAQPNSLKIVTPLCETGKFLKALGQLNDAFSLHGKKESDPFK